MSDDDAGGTDDVHAVLDRMSDGFFALDEDWAVTYLNERGREIIHAAIDEDGTDVDLRGRNIWDLIPDGEGSIFHEKYTTAMTEQTQVDFDAYYEPIDEWFSVRVYPSESGISVYFQSVTDDHRRSERLAEREGVLQDVQAAISDDRPFDAQVESLLDIGREVLGLGYGTLSRIDGDEYVFEVVSARDDAVEAGDTTDLAATNCERTARTEQATVLADVATDAPELTDRAGYTEWGISCYLGAPVYADGEVYGTFCFYDTAAREEPFTDWEVTLVNLLGKLVSYGLDRELTERELEAQNERLEEFALTVSHDLRNPLAVAQGHVSMTAEDPSSGSLDEALQALERMDDIISDLLDLARESGTVDVEAVDLGRVAGDVWDQVDATGELVVEDQAIVEADSGGIERLLENLIENALDHGGTTTGGPVVRVGALPHGFYVADDGPGIPEEDREQIFESGYTSRPDGTGFGLSIVERIADAHGWTVTVGESEAGGARFEFRTDREEPTPDAIV